MRRVTSRVSVRRNSVESGPPPAEAAPASPERTERIPALLQSVFLKSNRGAEVHKPPPKRLANRVFENNWIFRRGTGERKKKMYDGSRDKVLSKNKRRGFWGFRSKSEKDKKEKEKNAKKEKKAAPAPAKPVVEHTLQEYFDALLKERGYNIQLYNTLETGYYNSATELQIASYGPRMIQIVKSNDVPALRETLAGGLSPNPCNRFGESLLHMICRRGDIELLNVMVEAGAVLEVSDDYGRTPLHDACWSATPAFDVVKVILKRDIFLFFMKDKRGSLPLSYVHKDDWLEWMEWLDQNIDNYYPEERAGAFAPSELTNMKPNSFPLPEYKTDLSMELIKMVANGNLSPREARAMAETARQEDEETVADTVTDYDEEHSDSDSEYSDSDYDDDDEDDDDSDYDEMEEEEMIEMLRVAQMARASA